MKIQTVSFFNYIYSLIINNKNNIIDIVVELISITSLISTKNKIINK